MIVRMGPLGKANFPELLRIPVSMNGDDILAKVRKALHLADSIHAQDSDAVERLLKAADRARKAQQEFLDLLKQARPATPQGERAKATLLQHYSALEEDGLLLESMLQSSSVAKSEIYTRTPPSQVQ